MYKYSARDIEAWLEGDKVYTLNSKVNGKPVIKFNQFKKHLFPQFLLIRDMDDVVGSPGAQWENNFMQISC